MPARIFPPVGMRAGPCPSRVGAVAGPPCTATTGCGFGWAMRALLHERRDIPTIHALAASLRINPMSPAGGLLSHSPSINGTGRLADFLQSVRREALLHRSLCAAAIRNRIVKAMLP